MRTQELLWSEAKGWSRRDPVASAAAGIRRAECRDPFHASVHNTETVEVTTIVGRELRNELGPPNRCEAVVRIVCREAREPRVDEPDFVIDPGHFMNLNVAGNMTSARQETSIVLADRL